VAISEDGSTPATVTRSTSSAALSTASFSPPAGSLLVALSSWAAASGTQTATITDSGTHTWTLAKRANATGAGDAEISYTYLSSAPGSITVTGTPTSGGTTEFLSVRVLLGAASTQTGASAAHTSGTTPTISLTTTTVGSWVYGCMMDLANSQAALTANASSATITWFNNTTDGENAASFKASAATVTPGATTYGWSAGLTDTYMLAAWEVLPASGTVATSVLSTRAARLRASVY